MKAEQGQQSQVSNNRKPFPSRAYQNLTDAVAAIEGTERDVKFLGANESIFTFTGSLGEPTFPFRGMGGVLKLAEYDEDSPRIEILFGPYIMLGSGQKDAFKPFEWYFNRTYQIGEGKEVRLELTESDSHRHNGIAYVNPEQVLESAELLTNLSSEAEGVSPILCDPTIYMLTEAFKKRFEEGLVSLGTKVSLNRMMMYRGASEGAAKVLESCEQDIEKVPDPIFKSNFYICFADTCMRLGKLDPALGYTNKALEHSKDNFDAHLIAGITHQIAGDYQEAEKRLEQSLAISETEIAQQSLDRTRRVQELM